jgi:hypothetical protein
MSKNFKEMLRMTNYFINYALMAIPTELHRSELAEVKKNKPNII